ncbi:MAG: peptidoglycan-binding domain-containing protein [Polyangiales bacterium]
MPGMIERGARGDSVRDLQQALVDAGYDIEVDGIFGEDTESAVVDFQSNNGLDADGIVGPRTWRALGF